VHLLPDIVYKQDSKRPKSGTIAANGRRPDRIGKWDNFFDGAHQYGLNCTQTFRAPRLLDDESASNEAQVDSAFKSNVISNIRTFFNAVFSNRILFEQQESVCGGRPDHSVRDNGNVIFFSETKTNWNISPSDLVQQYNSERDATPETPSALVKAMEQVFGYLAEGKLQYGAMSTYDYTWFLKRPEGSRGCLQVSDRIANSSIGPSVLKCHTHAISLAMEDPDSSAPPD
jgi:hypothetical protein